MSQSNLTDYLRDLEIKIKGLQQKIQGLKTQKSEAEKEYTFKKDFVRKDVEKKLGDAEPDGLGLNLPKVLVDELNLSSETITHTLKTMYKLES